MSEPGDPSLPDLGQDIDIRSDIPRYRVWHNGELVAEPTDVRDLWRDDLVSVSYTHLDVYKRQGWRSTRAGWTSC